MGSKSKYKANEVTRDLFMEWLNYPSALARVAAGLPSTKGCFAQKHHISRTQLWRYEKDFNFQRERMENMQELVTADDWKAILLAQKANALNGNLNAAKWLDEKLHLSGDTLVEDTEEDAEQKRLAGMSEKELEAYLKEHDTE